MRAVLFLICFAAGLWGCSCMQPGPPCQEAWRFAAVFTGTATDIAEPAPPLALPIGEEASNRRSAKQMASQPRPTFRHRVVRFELCKALAGVDSEQKQIEIQTGLGGGDCGYPFRRAEDYLVYAYRSQEGPLETGICTRTRPLSEAAEDLAYFQTLISAPPESEIRIFAFDVHKPSQPDQPSGIPGVRVTIAGAGGQRNALTDASGQYKFTGLPPGGYKVDVALKGYASSDQPRTVQVHAKGCAEVWIPVQLDRRITGRVLTREGLPAAGVTVKVVRTRPEHENELPFAADSATTDQEGRYELRRISSGDYYLGINLDHTLSAQNPYTRWFYPGTEDPAAASVVHFSDQPDTQQYDLTLPARQKERIIKGMVFWPSGQPAHEAYLFLEDPRWPWNTSTVAAVADAQGRFLVHGFDGTRYRLHAVSPARFTNQSTSAEPIEIQPGNDSLDLRLVLSRKNDSRMEGASKGLDHWRKGLGLPRVP